MILAFQLVKTYLERQSKIYKKTLKLEQTV
nr:MAG TPA: hypothetical protein [Caudoviricetes sp.]